MKAITKKWVAFAIADLEAAKLQFRYGGKRGSAYMITVFHCHQAIEKLLKAYLIEQDREIKKSHDLTQLRVQTGIGMPGWIRDGIDDLQPHYLIPRYPDLAFEPRFSFTYNRHNVQKILQTTQRIFLWLERGLKKIK